MPVPCHLVTVPLQTESEGGGDQWLVTLPSFVDSLPPSESWPLKELRTLEYSRRYSLLSLEPGLLLLLLPLLLLLTLTQTNM